MNSIFNKNQSLAARGGLLVEQIKALLVEGIAVEVAGLRKLARHVVDPPLTYGTGEFLRKPLPRLRTIGRRYAGRIARKRLEIGMCSSLMQQLRRRGGRTACEAALRLVGWIDRSTIPV